MPDWSGEPAYKQLADELRSRIRSGRLKIGDQLPSLSALMAEFSVSSTVVRMALSELRGEGVIITHQGKGAFIRKAPGNAPDATWAPGALAAQLEELTSRVSALEADVKRLHAKH